MKRRSLTAAIAIAASAAITPLSLAQDEEKPPAAEAKPAAEATADAAKPAAEAPAADMDKVVIIVDGTEITQGEIDKRLNAQYGAQINSMPPEQAAMMREHALPSIKQAIISETILLEAADKANIELDQEKFDGSLKEIMANAPEGNSEEDFLKLLGMSKDELKTALSNEIRINTLLEKQTADVAEPTDEEIKKFYEDNEQEFLTDKSASASHILINTQDITDPAEKAKKKAELEVIRKEIIAADGKNFAEEATAHSDCPSGKRAGGSLGTFPPGQMVPAFDKVAFSQEVGTVSEIFETDFGYHIVQVTERDEGGKTPLEEVKEGIAAHLKRTKQEPIVTEYIKGLRDAATIQEVGGEKVAPAPAPEAKEAPAEMKKAPEEMKEAPTEMKEAPAEAKKAATEAKEAPAKAKEEAAKPE